MNKVVAVIFFVASLFAIKSVSEEILEIETISSTLRYVDILIRTLVAGFSFATGFGLWTSRRWTYLIAWTTIALNLVLRSLIFFSPQLINPDNLLRNGSGAALYLLVGAFLYYQKKSNLLPK